MGASLRGAAHAALTARSLGNACWRCYKVEVEIRLLGPLEVRDGERTLALPRRQQRALLAALALRAGEVVSTDRLVADLWGERAPPSATGSLQNAVSALRKVLGRDVVRTQAPGYRLALEPDSVDAYRFERLLAAARDADGRGAIGPPERGARPLARPGSFRSRRGAVRPFGGGATGRATGGRARRAGRRRAGSRQARCPRRRPRGPRRGASAPRAAARPADARRSTAAAGRREALEVYRAFRLALADELGLDPSPELQELERRILRHDPAPGCGGGPCHTCRTEA